MRAIIVNPGAGPIDEPASPEAAAHNVDALLDDLRALGYTATAEPLIGTLADTEEALAMGGTRYSTTHDGRFPFRVTVNGYRHLVEMPGLALERVRFLGEPDQDVFAFPRLFVDGSSWLWRYAVPILVEATEDYR